MNLTSLTSPEKLQLLVAVADLEGFAAIARGMDELELFALMDGFSRVLEAPVLAAGGRVLKWIGDAALIVFDLDDASAAVRSLFKMKEEAEAFLKKRGIASHLRVAVHAGECVVGTFGNSGQLDAFGETVNRAFMLEAQKLRSRLVLSAEAFRKLDTETRKLFKRWRSPDVYLGSEY